MQDQAADKNLVRIATGSDVVPESWRGGEFRFNPHDGHELYVFAEGTNQKQAIAEFNEEPIELAWDAKSLLVLGLVWRIGVTDPLAWRGTVYSIKTSQNSSPPIECHDARHLPKSVCLLKLVLVSRYGEVLADRHVRMSDPFGQSLHSQISRQSDAYNNPGWMDRVVGQLVRDSSTPSDFARNVGAARRCVASVCASPLAR